MKQKVIVYAVLVAVLLMASGCATIFHSDRMNIPATKKGSIDIGMFILDLILFWPGLIIDIATGCLWVPLPGYQTGG